MIRNLTTFVSALLLAACTADEPTDPQNPGAIGSGGHGAASSHGTYTATATGEEALATFAGGCFWCMETPFEDLKGVTAVISGYAGGHVVDPTYSAVCAGTTGHTESIQIHYDPGLISYGDLLEIFWRQIDPTDGGGQFVDRGTQYRSEIFFHDEEQRAQAEASKERLAASGRFEDPIVTEVTPLDVFYDAEEYHQDFYLKDPDRYYSYRKGSGRDRFIDAVWGNEREYEPKGGVSKGDGASTAPWLNFVKPSEEVLREQLTSLQFSVTQEDDTERPFRNEYWDNHDEGIYVDVVSGEPLFGSMDKFDSGTGWPSFTQPLPGVEVTNHVDHKLRYPRDEVRSAIANSHLGHVFPDGPAPTGQRFCINSASLRFVPVAELAKQGYGDLEPLFEGQDH